MSEDQDVTEAPAGEDTPEASDGAGEGKPDRPRKTHGQRALANLRTARRGQRDVTDDNERTEFLLAEANILALLDLADALRGNSGEAEE